MLMSSPRRIALVIIFVLLLGVGGFLFVSNRLKPPPPAVKEIKREIREVIGTSVEGRAIERYTYGNGEKHLLFVGGVHGGYEWNSVLLSYKFMDYLKANSLVLPPNIKITVIPSLNPDGIYKVLGKEGRFGFDDITNISKTTSVLEKARFNANDVDLNRNFDCKWKPESTWKSKKVSAGSTAFSEPEAKALRDFVLKNKSNLVATVFWHSQAGAVYASECRDGILPVTFDIMNTYARASGYKAIKTFDSYEVTGDAEGYLTSLNIPAITVELTTHNTVEWKENLSGIKALFDYFR